MHVSRARCSALFSSAVLLLGSLAFSPAALAQGAPARPATPSVSTGVATGLTPGPAAEQNGVVQRIVVQGAERIDQSTILSYLPIAPGDSVDPAKIDAALKALFRTDLFADVQIELKGADAPAPRRAACLP